MLDKSLVVVATLLAYVYACFYTALDVIAGIADGRLQLLDSSHSLHRPIFALFGQADDLATVGTWGLLAAFALIGVVRLRQPGVRSGWAGVGTVVLLAASWSFRTSHVYWPRGVLTMVAFAVGVAVLLWSATPAGARRAGTAGLTTQP